MKMKKIFASVAAVATVSALAVSASAADWSKASYADGDPNTVKIISFDENSVTFGATTAQGQAKCRITLSDVLENPEDVSKIKSGSWKVTYNGLSAYTGTEIGWLGGGTYCATGNSASVSLAPASYDENSAPVWDDSVTVEDSFKYLLPSSVPTDASAAEFVFMDWSGAADIYTNNVTVTVSDFKLFDADGNEIAQKGLSAAAEEAPAETEAAAEEAPAAEEVVEEAAVEEVAEEVVEETVEAPVADTTTTTPAATGNTAAAAIAAVMAVAGAAAVVSKRK